MRHSPLRSWRMRSGRPLRMSGLKINFDKIEVMILGYQPDEAQLIADRLNYMLGHFPYSYLGIPISDSRPFVADLRPTVSRLQHRIEPWQGRWLSKAARTVLINSSLSSLLIFMMSFYSLHEALHHEIAKYQSRFYSAREGDKQKYHMVLLVAAPTRDLPLLRPFGQ
ncbi:ABC transporter G family member 37 [Hordeum vulgare]|nr:ABC transporter G family member 37 [Hordeum vulgare]